MVCIALSQCVWLGDMWNYIDIILLLRVAALHVYSYCNKWVKFVHACDLCSFSPLFTFYITYISFLRLFGFISSETQIPASSSGGHRRETLSLKGVSQLRVPMWFFNCFCI